MRRDRVYVMFLYGILISLSYLYAQSWGPVINISNNDSLSEFGYPTFWGITAENNGRVHIVWMDQQDPQWAAEVYYRRSLDNGNTFENPVALTTNSSYWQETPCIAHDNFGRLHVVWTEFYYLGALFYPNVYYKRSNDGGATWETKKLLAPTYGDFAGNLSLTTDLKNGVYTIYMNQEDPNSWIYDIYLKRSVDGGTTWSPAYRLTRVTYVGATVYSASVAADTLNRVHVVWMDDSIGIRQIYYRRSTNNGATFGPKVALTSYNSFKGDVCISTNRGNIVHVVWEDKRDGNWEIYYRRSTDGGVNWEAERRLTSTSTSSITPNITADMQGNVYIVWQEGQEVYFMESNDNGSTWGQMIPLTSGAIGDYLFPNIAAKYDGEYLHVAWTDEKDGDKDVYYRRRYPVSAPEKETFSQNYAKILFSSLLFKDKIIFNLSLEKVNEVYENTPLKIFLYNIYGAPVFESIINSGITTIILEDPKIKNLGKGTYFLKLFSKDEKEIAKFKLIKF